ncbi:MAG: TolC family protein [Bdellovibrionales bacterium]|nr:TolC family protein [Bdellovibrionales bacterium]
MKRQSALLFSIISFFLIPAAMAASNEILRLEDFMNQVRAKNDAVKAATENREGSKARSADANLLFTPTLGFDLNAIDDRKRGLLFPLNRQVLDTATLAISNQFSLTGTQLRAGYTLQNFEYYFASGATTKTYLGSPFVEVRQPLWRNFLGSESRATRDLLQSDAMAKHYEETMRLKQSLTGAEGAYWRLAVARQWLKIQTKALERAKNILDHNEKKARLGLGDKADVYQATALHQARKLELQAAKDEERSARVSFNLARGRDGQEVTEKLLDLYAEENVKMETPKRAGIREDALAAQERVKQAEASAQQGKERNRPTLEAFASYTMNAYTGQALASFSDAFSANQPTRAIGLKFSVPLDLVSTHRSIDGYAREQAGAELNANRKLFEQEQEWLDLSQKSEEAKLRLKLAHEMEDAQEKKLSYERDRLNRGRSTTAQVALFENDYSQAQLARMRAQVDVLGLNAQMKTFSELK